MPMPRELSTPFWRLIVRLISFKELLQVASREQYLLRIAALCASASGSSPYLFYLYLPLQTLCIRCSLNRLNELGWKTANGSSPQVPPSSDQVGRRPHVDGVVVSEHFYKNRYAVSMMRSP